MPMHHISCERPVSKMEISTLASEMYSFPYFGDHKFSMGRHTGAGIRGGDRVK